MAPLDLVKLHRTLYSPSARLPAIVEVPDLAFLMVDGRGDPEHRPGVPRGARGAVLRRLHAQVRLKKTDPDRDFKVAPLEGLWWADDARPPWPNCRRPRRLELDDADRRARRGHGG